jgi:hypothetical protein
MGGAQSRLSAACIRFLVQAMQLYTPLCAYHLMWNERTLSDVPPLTRFRMMSWMLVAGQF